MPEDADSKDSLLASTGVVGVGAEVDSAEASRTRVPARSRQGPGSGRTQKGEDPVHVGPKDLGLVASPATHHASPGIYGAFSGEVSLEFGRGKPVFLIRTEKHTGTILTPSLSQSVYDSLKQLPG